MEMVWIEPGTFTMGAGTAGYPLGDGPEHQVTITQGFYLGKYELTLGQWESVVSADVPGWKPVFPGNVFGQPRFSLGLTRFGPDHPANCMSWHHTQNIVSKLNAAEGDSVYRLPTEAEWEYACRAGTTTMWFFGDDPSLFGEYAWYGKKASGYIEPVGQKLPNTWGLYDMYGNIREWCWDWYGPYSAEPQVDPMGPTDPIEIRHTTCMFRQECYTRIVRGGSIMTPYGLFAKSASRYMIDHGSNHDGLCGMRLLRMSPGSSSSVAPETWGQIKRLHGE